MGATSIQWTDFSHNPIRARLKTAAAAGLTKGGYGSGVGHYCEKISPGCAHCYSSTTQPRFGMPEFPGAKKGDPAVEVFLDEERLVEPLSWRKPRKVFLCDMTDLFGPWVPFEWIDRIFAVMALTPHLTWQILTKRPERMAEYLSRREPYKDDSLDTFDLILLRAVQICNDVLERGFADENHSYEENTPWPLPNVWLGTSVENQKFADERIPHLLRCPAAVRFLSVEPMLGPIDLNASRTPGAGPEDDALGPPLGGDDGISWVIVGGEAGTGSRPFNVAWARSIIEQCKAAGVACFVKQLGGNVEWNGVQGGYGNGPSNVWPRAEGNFPVPGGRWRKHLIDKKGGDIEEWPEDLRVRNFPERAVVAKEPA